MKTWNRLVRSVGSGDGGQARVWEETESEQASQRPTVTFSCSLLLSRPVCGPVEKLSQVPGLWVSLHDLRGFL